MSSMVVAGPGARTGVVVELRPRVQRVSAARPPRAEAPLRLTRRGRVVLSLLALLVVALGAVLFASGADADAPAAPQEVTVHTVASGESLWQIASAAPPAGQDVRDVMDDVMELNQLSGSQLSVGQQLVVPVLP
jgi:Tfp pilus assembly protein FimV